MSMSDEKKMPLPPPACADAHWLIRPNLPKLAYRATAGHTPGIVFLGGLASDMTGTKALALEAAATADGRAFLRMDYRGHGRSEGRFEDGTIGDWFADALAVFDAATEGPQLLVGSSMGGWLALLLALARPERIIGLIGIAAAPDFTERLVWDRLDADSRSTLQRDGAVLPPARYGSVIPMTLRLIEEGRDHLLLNRPIPFRRPVRLLHGQRDPDVPWQHALLVAERLDSDDVQVILIKDGDHRLSRPRDIALILRTARELTHPDAG